jgi:large-conductance mechanosensitive channel
VTRSPGKKVTVVSALSFVTDQAGHYVHWGVVLISVTNLLIIVAMVLVFFLALILPFGSKQDRETAQERARQ